MKIGIISMYHKNVNYGGLLQAYALVRKISGFQYDAEQICWAHAIGQTKVQSNKTVTVRSILRFAKKQVKAFLKKIRSKKIAQRNQNIAAFEKSIPHSQTPYTADNIATCNQYDIYISGSDQVWNMAWYNKEYFLDFVKDGKYIFSYAASMPNINLSKEQEETVVRHLKKFDAISVREEKSQKYLESVLHRDVQWVLDPTLLLSAEEWDEVCSEPLIKEKYVFTYFLGEDKNHRKAARQFAKKMNLKLVTIPHLNTVVLSDIGYGDMRVNDASPTDFIALIKNAEYVITDSFHAAVFSNIYQVKFFVFGRGDMNERIYTLTRLFDNQNRFCDADADIMYGMKDEELSQNTEQFHQMKQKSIEFLFENLKAGERSRK